MRSVIRQGDILLRPIDQIPGKLVEMPEEDGQVVLAYGERSGHRHSLPYGGALMYMDHVSGSTFLSVKADTKLSHLSADGAPTGDHAELNVPAGDYEIVRQRQAEGDRVAYQSD